MEFWKEAIIFLAAFGAGIVNTLAGGGTLLTFPALIWMGRDPILANATSTVALFPGSLTGMLGFRRELTDSRGWMIKLGVPSFAGGVFGAFLLLRTPSDLFAYIAPWLILFATCLMIAQEPLSRWLKREPDGEPNRVWWTGAIIFQFLVGIYGGYFGAGIGILMLAALGLLGFTDLHQMNGLKNLFAMCINGVAAAYFIFLGAVIWFDVLVMVVAAILGSLVGAKLAYRLGRRFVRYFVITVGAVMALTLFAFPG